jgi:hypothetical protein
MHEWDVEDFKRRITRRQLRRWMAFYLIEPWGQPWLVAGRMTSLIRAGLVGKFDKHDEERFLITYRQGDEYRPKVALTEDEISGRLAALPGLKKRSKRCLKSARSRPSSRPTRAGSSPA